MSEQVILRPVCLIGEPDIIACICLIVHISLIRHNYTAPYVKQNTRTWFYYFTLFEINLNLSHKSQVYSAKRSELKKTRGKENGCMWDRGSRSRLWECVYCQRDFGSFSWSADVKGGCWLVRPAVHSCSWSVWDNVVSVSWSPLLQKERERVCGLGRHSQDVSGSAEADIHQGTQWHRREWGAADLKDFINMILILYFKIIQIFGLKKTFFHFDDPRLGLVVNQFQKTSRNFERVKKPD